MTFALIRFRWDENSDVITQVVAEDELENIINSKDDLDYLIDPEVRKSYECYKNSFVVLHEFESDIVNFSERVQKYLEEWSDESD